MEISVMICKLMTQFTMANRAVQNPVITSLLEYLSQYRKSNPQQGVTLSECKLLFYSLTACRPAHLKAIEYGLQIF